MSEFKTHDQIILEARDALAQVIEQTHGLELVEKLYNNGLYFRETSESEHLNYFVRYSSTSAGIKGECYPCLMSHTRRKHPDLYRATHKHKVAFAASKGAHKIMRDINARLISHHETKAWKEKQSQYIAQYFKEKNRSADVKTAMKSIGFNTEYYKDKFYYNGHSDELQITYTPQRREFTLSHIGDLSIMDIRIISQTLVELASKYRKES